MSGFFFFSSRRRHTRSYGDWSSDVCSSDLGFAIFDIVEPGGLVDVEDGEPGRDAVARDLTPLGGALEAGRDDRAARQDQLRSEERRVGKEGGSRWAGGEYEKKVE